MKKQSDLSRLMGYAGNYRYFTYASWVLSAVSALVALVPFVYIWKILRDVLNAAPDYAQAVNIPHYGWMAVLFAVLAYLIYIAALMCSHRHRLFCRRQIFRGEKFNDILHGCLIIIFRNRGGIPVGVIALEPALQIT